MQRDQYREELKEMVDQKKKVEKEKLQATLIAKEKILILESKNKKLSLDLDTAIDDFMKLEKQYKQLIDEREKMKQQIHKLKSRKGKIDKGYKTCKNCGKEYLEKDNVNWSCRIHRLDYSEDT